MSQLKLASVAVLSFAFGLSALADGDHGGTCESATMLLVGGGMVQGVIDPGTDEDWFSFAVEAGHEYMISLVGVSSAVSSKFPANFEVYGADCSTVLVLEFPADRFTASTPGVHYIRITSREDLPGVYKIGVMDLERMVDDHGHSPESATILSPNGQAVGGVTNYRGDLDGFKFTANEQTLYTIELRSLEEDLLVYGLLATPVGFMPYPLLAGDDAWQGITFYVGTGEAGDYYALVLGFLDPLDLNTMQMQEGAYEVRLREMPVSDNHGSTCESATVLTVGDDDMVEGVIDPGTDEDWFSFSVEAGHEYMISLGTVLLYFRANLEVFGADCSTVLIPDSLDYSLYRFTASTTGPHYIRVTGTGNLQGVYDIGVMDLGEMDDDHGNHPGSATILSPNGEIVGGVMNYGGDWDYFRFTASERTLYTIEVRSLEDGLLVFGWLEEPDGRVPFSLLAGDDAWQRTTYYVGTGEAGDYYLLVASLETQFYPGLLKEGAYELRLREMPISGVHGGTCESATVLPVGEGLVDGVIDPDTDEDWFSFAVETEHEYQISMEGLSSNFRVNLELYGADCSTVLVREYPGDRFIASTTGPHYVRIKSAEGLVGSYEIGIRDLGEMVDDHGNHPESATPLPTDGVVVGGEMNYDGDFDYFRFAAGEQTLYAIELRSLEEGLLVLGQLEDRDGATLLWSFAGDGDWHRVSYYVSAGGAGDYYLWAYGLLDGPLSPFYAPQLHEGAYEVRVLRLKGFVDCNGNGLDDFCDVDCGLPGGYCDRLGCGASEDCAEDGIPDECEPDCNNSGFADSCDILDERSVDCTGNGIPDECEPDCNENTVADSCDIASGESADCNLNGVPDECDMAQGHSHDCNANAVPDSCDIASGESADCNLNGVPDECDMAQGHSHDCNANRTLDECEPGACCVTPTQCAELYEDECVEPGGVFRGPCSECPSQNVEVIFEPGGDVFVHVIAPPVECSVGALRTTRACSPGAVFIDPWKSPADGNMCHSFGVDGSPAIPADFFAGGSEPFIGMVCLAGEPLRATGYGEFGDADTLIARTEDPFDMCAFPSDEESTVALKVVALSLKSVEPITVMVNGQQEQWDASVNLSDEPAPPGMLTAVKSHCNGGTYTSVVKVRPRFTFTKVNDPTQERVLDTGLEGIDPVTLAQVTPAPWVSIVDMEFGVQADSCSAFHAGVNQMMPGDDCDCNTNGTHDACEIDCNNNWVADECDIDAGTSKDCNATGVPDECEAIASGDFDANGRVDLHDFAEFLVCRAGPGTWPVPGQSECANACIAAFDIDYDADVDLEDFARFEVVMVD